MEPDVAWFRELTGFAALASFADAAFPGRALDSGNLIVTGEGEEGGFQQTPASTAWSCLVGHPPLRAFRNSRRPRSGHGSMHKALLRAADPSDCLEAKHKGRYSDSIDRCRLGGWAHGAEKSEAEISSRGRGAGCFILD